jgi:predicted deacylase
MAIHRRHAWDEYEGQIALTKLIRALEPGDDRFRYRWQP